MADTRRSVALQERVDHFRVSPPQPPELGPVEKPEEGARLLSNDQTFSEDLTSDRGKGGSEVCPPASSETVDLPSSECVRVPGSVQGRFPLREFEGLKPRKVKRANYHCKPLTSAPPNRLELLYEERAGARLRTRSIQTYRSLRVDMLALASNVAGRPISILALFEDPALLGAVLVSNRLADGRVCSKSTIAHRRTAIRSVASVLHPELCDALGCDPHTVIRDGLRSVAERRGGGLPDQCGHSAQQRWTDAQRR